MAAIINPAIIPKYFHFMLSTPVRFEMSRFNDGEMECSERIGAIREISTTIESIIGIAEDATQSGFSISPRKFNVFAMK